MNEFSYKGSFYGHFGHACVHTRINFDLKSKDGIAKFRKFMEHAADLVISYGGSLSGEHGDGQARAELLPKMFGPELMQAFRKFKSAWDPGLEDESRQAHWFAGKPPTGSTKIFASAPTTRPGSRKPISSFPPITAAWRMPRFAASASASAAANEGGVMCPSYRATREEEHSTRGRAHLLWEMTQGEVIRDGWRSEEVKSPSIFAWPAKDARAIARSASTSPPTKPSFFRTTTKAAFARAALTPSATSISGRAWPRRSRPRQSNHAAARSFVISQS